MQYCSYKNFYDIIENNAIKSPKKTIISQNDLKINNHEFKIRVDAVAQFLKDQGIQSKDKVALIMSNSWQFIVNVFAVSKLGAIAVPINNFLKEEEFAYIVNDCQAKFAFISHKFIEQTKSLLVRTGLNKITWVEGDSLKNEKNLSYEDAISTKIEPKFKSTSKLDDTAFIVYTSGTTGKPKGAMLSYKNILSNGIGCLDIMNIKKGLTMLSYLPMFHAFSLTATVFTPILSNGEVVVFTSMSSKKDFKYLLKMLLFKRCKYFTGVPDIFSAMARAKLPWYFHWFHNVIGFISGAAPLSEEVQRRFTEKFKRGTLYQGYGISECSPIVSSNAPKAHKIGSVGRPLKGYQVKIFDENMHELPLGEVGEICVKGDCVMQGYYNRPDETAEAIIDGWFKTGDLGKLDTDGFIFIVDRKKDLIIHKGMNIYPREIEEILYTHEKINACAIVGLKDSESNEVPIAYIELKEDQLLTENEIKEFLKPHLAVFKMPRKVYFMEKLPRNATGKILKRELRDIAQQEAKS